MIPNDTEKMGLEKAACVLAEDIQSIDRQIAARAFENKYGNGQGFNAWLEASLRSARTKISQLRGIERTLGNLRSGVESHATRYFYHKKSILGVVNAAIVLANMDDSDESEAAIEAEDRAYAVLKSSVKQLLAHFPDVADKSNPES